MKLKEILNGNDEIYVGVKNGMGGMIRLSWNNPVIAKREFNISSTPHGWQYLSVPYIKALYNWAAKDNNEAINIIEWNGKPFFTDILYLVAKAQKEKILIGMKGGIKSLIEMSSDKIKKRDAWEISSEKKNSQWFSGSEFIDVLENKGIRYNKPE